VVNYEEGGENAILHGDSHSESYLTEVVGTPPLRDARNLTVESVYEYGSRAGFWPLLRLFNERNLPFTTFAVAMARDAIPRSRPRWLNPVTRSRAMAGAGSTTRMFPKRSSETICGARSTPSNVSAGERPLGWYTGRISANTGRLVVEEGGFLYDADAYNDDMPYWETVAGKAHLVVPYTLDINDMKFGTQQGFNAGDQFLPTSRTRSMCSIRRANGLRR
jgi:allantoinase